MSNPNHMQAVIFKRYGGSEVLEYAEVPVPNFGDDELLVRVHSAGVSPFDIHVREGWYKKDYYTLPIILGWELSGVVVAIGKHVTQFKIGDAIFSYPNALRVGSSYAEYNVIKAEEAVLKPAAISHHEASAASMNAITAWQTLFDVAKISEGQRVLIQAAAGGVGHLAVQLAKWKGAYVIGTASAKNAEFLNQIGVDEYVDYTKTPLEKAVKPVDVVIDTIGGEVLQKSFQLVKKGGIVVTMIDFEGIKAANTHGIEGKTVFALPNSQQLTEIAKLLAQGTLKPFIQSVFPLTEAAKAHQAVESGHVRGKIVLEIPS
ncbi:MAG TPA: NADP-dependent oxidoreductase [Gammaproteobacteria bacterium]|nr:NADP-dependent oxidoreductase [Gammaproteobacteria bacterium]